MAQTAVEWQFNELQKIEKAWAKQVIDGMEFVKMKYEILEKAKEMEKQEKIEFALKVCIERVQTHGGNTLEIAKKLANL